MSEIKPKVQEWMQPDTSEVRLNRMWSRISEHRARPRAWRWALVGGAVATLAAVVTTAVWPRERVLREADRFSATVASQARFEDGSRVEVTQASELVVDVQQPQLTQVRLRSGAAVFDVERRPTRRFEVLAGDVSVRVIGTRFSVSVNGQVEVKVERGIVEVHSGPDVRRLTAGEGWTSPAQVLTEANNPVEAQGIEALEAESSFETDPVKPHPTRHRKRPVAQAKKTAEASSAPTTPAVGGEPVTAQQPPSPAELFQKAIAARRAGRSAEAIAVLEQFLGNYPQDARAAVAAFELGRLRMDTAGDLPGSAAALEKSLELSLGGEVREEALSRLVRAYEGLGKTAACLKTRDQYLKWYPEGSYAQTIRTRCGSP